MAAEMQRVIERLARRAPATDATREFRINAMVEAVAKTAMIA